MYKLFIICYFGSSIYYPIFNILLCFLDISADFISQIHFTQRNHKKTFENIADCVCIKPPWLVLENQSNLPEAFWVVVFPPFIHIFKSLYDCLFPSKVNLIHTDCYHHLPFAFLISQCSLCLFCIYLNDLKTNVAHS